MGLAGGERAALASLSCAGLPGVGGYSGQPQCLEEDNPDYSVKTVPVTLPFFPQDVVGEVPSVLVEPVLGVLSSVQLEVQYEGRTSRATLGSS